MKKIFLFIGLFFITFSYSQEGKPIGLNRDMNNHSSNFTSGGKGIWVKLYSSSSSSNIEGSNYLFDNWLNSASIYAIDKKGYKISGINFNVKYNRFEARLSDVSKEDSTFVFNSNSINKVVIGNQEFVKKEFDGKGVNYFIEVITQGNKISLLKSYRTSLMAGASNPMTKEKFTDDKIVIIPTYYIERNGQLEEVKLKKSSMLKLMSDKKSEVKDFLSKTKLSFKEEDDIKKIFTYYNSI